MRKTRRRRIRSRRMQRHDAPPGLRSYRRHAAVNLVVGRQRRGHRTAFATESGRDRSMRNDIEIGRGECRVKAPALQKRRSHTCSRRTSQTRSDSAVPVERRAYDDEKHAHFVTFSCYKRRKLLQPDQAKRIVTDHLGSRFGGASRGVSLEFGGVVSCREIGGIADPLATGVEDGR